MGKLDTSVKVLTELAEYQKARLRDLDWSEEEKLVLRKKIKDLRKGAKILKFINSVKTGKNGKRHKSTSKA